MSLNHCKYNVLALDTGEYTGWCTYIDGQTESGVEHLKHKGTESPGFKFLRFTELLRRLDKIGHFDIIVYEKPHGLKGHAIEAANGYLTKIKEFIAIRETEGKIIDYKGVSPATIKKQVTGNGRASKEQMIAWFETKVGRVAVSSDEADSRAIMCWVLEELGET